MPPVTFTQTAQDAAGAWHGQGAVVDVDDATKARLTKEGAIMSDKDHEAHAAAAAKKAAAKVEEATAAQKAAAATAKKVAADKANAVRAPNKKPARLVAILGAHAKLIEADPDKTNTANWMTANPAKPECKALEGVLGWAPTAEDRDAAFDQWMEAQTEPKV